MIHFNNLGSNLAAKEISKVLLKGPIFKTFFSNKNIHSPIQKDFHKIISINLKIFKVIVFIIIKLNFS